MKRGALLPVDAILGGVATLASVEMAVGGVVASMEADAPEAVLRLVVASAIFLATATMVTVKNRRGR